METQIYTKETKGYNGHKNWTHWNVSLWLYNDEGMYRMVMDAIKRRKSLDGAIRLIKSELPAKTPDGASYSLCSIREAIREDFVVAKMEGLN